MFLYAKGTVDYGRGRYLDGQRFEASDDDAALLIKIGKAEPAERATTAADDRPRSNAQKKSDKYNRRDMRAQEN